jgi:hypothetical protein
MRVIVVHAERKHLNVLCVFHLLVKTLQLGKIDEAPVSGRVRVRFTSPVRAPEVKEGELATQILKSPGSST